MIICCCKNISRCNPVPDIKVNETDIERVKQTQVVDIVLSDGLSDGLSSNSCIYIYIYIYIYIVLYCIKARKKMLCQLKID